MDTERGDLTPRQIEAAGLTNLELVRAYYSEVRVINRVRGVLAPWERIGGGAVVAGAVLEVPALVTLGGPVLLASYVGDQILTGDHVIWRSVYYNELKYRHNLGEIPLPRAA